jgi:putative spermidine/putrescine transport system permease protein
MEAAEILGANKFISFIKIILPNIRLGLLITTLLIFSSFFGEFVLTNLLIGGRYETIRIYMLRRMNENGHLASAVMVAYFILLILISFIITYLTSSKRRVRKQKCHLDVALLREDNRSTLTPSLESVSIPKVEVHKEERLKI